MKRKFKRLILITLISLIALFSISTALAPPLKTIGDATQLYPFESQPTAVEIGSRAIASSNLAYDGDVSTKTADVDFTPGYLGFDSFEKPSDVGKTDFTIKYVDFKMRYTSLGSIDDEYRIVYYVGATGPVVLKDWIGGSNTLCLMSMPSDTLAQTWGNQTEPEDGTWTWAEIASIKFRFETRAVGPPDLPPFLYVSQIYEVWLSVYPDAPIQASTTYSIMPAQVESIPTLYDVAFIDFYVTNVSRLQLYEAELHFDSSALYAYQAWTYWPFITQAYLDTATPGVIKISYYIATTIPYNGHYLTDYGWNGTYPLARMYFYVMSTGPSWLIYKMTKLIAPAGIYLSHGNAHGVYGTPTAGVHLLTWKSTSAFDYTNPVCTDWVETYPEAGRQWHLTSHEENQPGPPEPDGELNPSDQIDMTSPEHPGEVWWFHVDEIGETGHDPTPGAADPYSVYMILTFKYIETPEFPLGLGLMLLLAPAIPIVYLWRTRKKAKRW